MARYTTDEVLAMMQAPEPEVEVLDKPASPFLDPAQINAAESELNPPTPEEPFVLDQTPAPQRPAGGNAMLYPSRNETSPDLPKPRYTTDEVISLYASDPKPRYSTQQVMAKMIAPLYDPTLPRPSKEEYFKLRDVEKQLRDSGELPSNFEEAATAVGGFVMTAVDAFNTALWKVDKEQGLFEFGGMGVNPALAWTETWRRAPATLNYGLEMTKQGYNAMASGIANIGGPKYRVKETGEFIPEMAAAMEASQAGLAGQPANDDIVSRYKKQGLTLEPVNDEDRRDWEYLQWNQGMDRSALVEKARTAELPPEATWQLAAGLSSLPFYPDKLPDNIKDYLNKAKPMESQALLGSVLTDPVTYASFGAGAARTGLSAAMKGATARSVEIIGKAAQRFATPAEIPVTAIKRFQKAVMSPAKVAGAYGAASGVAWASDQLNLPSELKTAAFTAASMYTAYKGGLGALRFVGNKFPEAAVILREAADPTNGMDLAARQAVAANADVPASIRDRLLRPSQFASIESTPARLAQNQNLSPATRKLMDKLSNWYVVQGVRGASSVASGAVKGGIAAAPFAEATRLSGDDRSANAIYGMGVALGAAGGAADRVLGARGRRVAQAESDIGRMLVDVAGNISKPNIKRMQWINQEVGRLLTDVELAAGDVSALVKNRSMDELARVAAMQGFFRSKVDYVPLNAADFELNASQLGGSGSAGFFIHSPDGQRPRVYVNVEARRADVEPHEFYEAFFASDAFSPDQRDAMRASVDQRYGADGLMAKGREYATQLIKAENEKNFPNENLVISDDQIALKMRELEQSELERGGTDALDWVRREVMVEEARVAGIDFAAIRKNIPMGANPINFMESVLGASARALGLSGVRVDPETGMAITPEQLFKDNPVAANDPKIVKHLNEYIKAYRQWMNDPAHEVPTGRKVARDGRFETMAANPEVRFYADPDAPNGPRTNTFGTVMPDGTVVEKSPKQRRDERKLRNTQVKNMAGRDLLEPSNSAFGLKRWADGRVRASGKRLPNSIAYQNHWKPYLPIIRGIEGLADAGESQQVSYFAKGNSADKVKTSKPQDIDLINREMVFDQWTTNKDGDLLAQYLDLTTIRNRVMRAIAERNPALSPDRGGAGYSLEAVMNDVFKWMEDKRAGKDGGATIGEYRKNVVNALINPNTGFNRGRNELAGAFGKGSAIKTLLLEGINAVSGTGRKNVAADYGWVNGNFMPEKPIPRPDMDSDVPVPRGLSARMMPDVAVVPERFTGTGDEIGRQSRRVQPPDFFNRFAIQSYERGGKFFDAATGDDLTGKTYETGFIDVSTGKPRLFVDAPASGIGEGKTYRTNLFKQKAGWQWVSDNAPATSTIVSVEGGGRHVYALRSQFDGGVSLARYSDKASEPRLRPTAKGDLVVGQEIGRISIRGREHPVYDGVRIESKMPRPAMMVEKTGSVEDMPQSALKVLHADSDLLPKPQKKTTNATVALALSEAARRHYGDIITSSNITPEQESQLMMVGADEAEAALKASGKNAGNWYSKAVQTAVAVAGVIHKELSDAGVARSHPVLAKEADPVRAAQFAMRLPLAITSQNMTVPLNTRASNEQFGKFLQTGKFDPSIAYGEKAKSISGNLDLANVMIERMGSIMDLEAFVSAEFTVRDLEAKASLIAGRKVTISGRKDDIVNGAAIFGPKIGQGFLQNLMGNFSPVTIDLWMRRTWGRWTGDVVGDGVTAQRLARIIDASRKAGRKLPDQIKKLRTTMRSVGETKTGKPKKPELTMSEDIEARLDSDVDFRKSVELFAKEANAEFQGLYRLMSDPMSEADAKKARAAIARAESLPDDADAILNDAFNALVRSQSAVKNRLDKQWGAMSTAQKKQHASKAEWLASRHAAEGRTTKLENPEKNALKPQWANAAKAIVSELNPIDVPSDIDRRVISRVVNGIREEMQRRGYTVTNADVQAILWYPEKDLWAKLRGEEESSLKQSYDDEFINIAESLGLGQQARQVAKGIRGY